LGFQGESLSFHQVLLQAAPEYLEQFGQTMPSRQREVLERILRCRTPEMGGHLFACPDCGTQHFRWHSCNDRHCPQCGDIEGQRWLAKQRDRLLFNTPYALITFTLPDPIRKWMRSHQSKGYPMLFECSWRALKELAANPKRLGGDLGALGVLQTWSRTLIYHPHVHYLIPQGALSVDQRVWIESKSSKYLLPFTPLADRFRNLFLQHFKEIAPDFSGDLPKSVFKGHWVVDVRCVGNGDQALTYLSRYIFQTATGNRQVTRLPNGKVRWPYFSNQTGRGESLELEPKELVRRFLQHVLPKGFRRVRYFGWFHHAARIRANRVRALLKQPAALTQHEKGLWLELPEDPQIDQIVRESTLCPKPPPCPRCGKPMQQMGSIEPVRGPPYQLLKTA